MLLVIASSLLPLSRTRWNILDIRSNSKLSKRVSEDTIPASQHHRPSPLPHSLSHSNTLLSAYYTTGGKYEPPVWMMVNYTLSTFSNPTKGANELQIINLIYDLFNDIAFIPFSNAVHEYLRCHTNDARGLICISPGYDDHKTIEGVYSNGIKDSNDANNQDMWIFKQGNISPVLVKGYNCFKQWADIEIEKHKEKRRIHEVSMFGIDDDSSDEEEEEGGGGR